MHGGMDLIDHLLRNTDETPSCHSNQPWTITIHDTLSPEGNAADDFLDALLGGSDSSSAPASPLWSPCTTDSGINEDPQTDPTESLHPASCTAFPAFDTNPFPQPPPLENQPAPNEKMSDVSIDLGWESGDLQEQFDIAYYLQTTNQTSPLSSDQTLTVKDLLLSNLGQTAQQIPQHSLQELVLNEDEKKLLAKEGVNLPSKLPLSKFEERVLKKIRRKIRNKHSAQESRKKKREYVDSLEGRMSACSANNLELQRKIQELEKTNNALLEQLNWLQALLPNSSSKTKHRGTCILVFLLSFSLLISSNLQPDPYSQLSQGEYTQSKVPSRSLQSMDEARDVPPLPLLSVTRGFKALYSLTEKH
ncbi:cyclic AMP-responsive element-binding protein 3-like protein 3-A isoform X2 [Siniperca chuatsi]|uniref:cyclic AMP-responsive element-binding protein 3-like protein 3-A isoform X2 n=1 Tax=Siniperca chuatsi TaxID=119488 RepID=UPI001CE0C6EB|nr:cyclic AMP-responsive element-binding protein 3-like protein 3-A isoform X2 [Siniperca chuatsi]XP_044074207.1 cyclic AMP-responsive element-binding protein 3-like protein 3-A isoform X2 [Siniperca chuatsi]XP_044074208.1 cyclic AMP-responsive element-binding protein 3-like protein 3-A isoform X2 [Siniperca chuatsi]